NGAADFDRPKHAFRPDEVDVLVVSHDATSTGIYKSAAVTLPPVTSWILAMYAGRGIAPFSHLYTMPLWAPIWLAKSSSESLPASSRYLVRACVMTSSFYYSNQHVKRAWKKSFSFR